MSSSDTGASPIRGGLPRPVEALCAGVALVLTAPLLCVVAAAIRATSPGPVLFRQRRVGRGGSEFTLLKFRTMRVNQDQLGVTARGDARVTPLGRWLRLLKLDEIPELWNVVRGEMSLVGPRPEVPRYVDVHDPVWRRVLQVRPGITHPVTLELRNEERLLARVAGDTELFYVKVLLPYKLAGYVDYLRHRSPLADTCVIAGTLLSVIAPAIAPPPEIEAVRAAVRVLRQHRDE